MIKAQKMRLCITVHLLTFILATPMVALSVEPPAQKPCAEEIEKFCGDVRPGEGRIVQCLLDHDSELSTACRDKVKAVVRKLEEAKQACANDISKFCTGVTPGGGRLLNCLKAHSDELSPECREKFRPVKARFEGTGKP